MWLSGNEIIENAGTLRWQLNRLSLLCANSLMTNFILLRLHIEASFMVVDSSNNETGYVANYELKYSSQNKEGSNKTGNPPNHPNQRRR